VSLKLETNAKVMARTDLDNVYKDDYLELMKLVLTGELYEQSAWSIVEMDVSNWRKMGFWKRVRGEIKNFIITELAKRSLILVRKNSIDLTARKIGRDWPQMFGYTMIGKLRLDNIQKCVEQAIYDKIPGDLIETGVWRGGATIFMRAVLKSHGIESRCVWVADSFQGLPSPKFSNDGYDLSAVNHLKVSLNDVKDNFARFGLLDSQVRFLEGWFENTLPSAPIRQLAVLRLDGDMYSSTMDALENLYPKLSPGGFVIVDDYLSWHSCRSAVNDYLAKHNLNVNFHEIDRDAIYWRKGFGA
jgi:O-methyltransferase